MRTVTAVFAVVLVVLGLALYLATGRESVTALIPSFFGVAFGVCALVASGERRRHAMHAAAVLALLGVGGSATGIPAALRHLGGEAIARPEAAWGRSAMALLCVVFLVLAIRSFVQARRARAAAAGEGA